MAQEKPPDGGSAGSEVPHHDQSPATDQPSATGANPASDVEPPTVSDATPPASAQVPEPRPAAPHGPAPQQVAPQGPLSQAVLPGPLSQAVPPNAPRWEVPPGPPPLAGDIRVLQRQPSQQFPTWLVVAVGLGLLVLGFFAGAATWAAFDEHDADSRRPDRIEERRPPMLRNPQYAPAPGDNSTEQDGS